MNRNTYYSSTDHQLWSESTPWRQEFLSCGGPSQQVVGGTSQLPMASHLPSDGSYLYERTPPACVSSPNTPNLRDLQEKEPLTKLINSLISINRNKTKPKPILLKIAPDLNNNQLLDIISIVKDTGLDGIIATNTTINRDNLKSVNKNELGGLSGKPLTSRSTEVIKFISKNSNKTIPIIGVGGINTVADALEKFDAGADLIQIYTGFIYEGPNLIRSINKALLNKV